MNMWTSFCFTFWLFVFVRLNLKLDIFPKRTHKKIADLSHGSLTDENDETNAKFYHKAKDDLKRTNRVHLSPLKLSTQELVLNLSN